MPGKIIEDLKLTTLYRPVSRTAQGTLYENGGTTGSGLDTKDFDEVVFDVNVGAIAGTTTLDMSVVASDDDNADNATAVSGATFTQIANANQNTSRRASLLCKNTKRYLWVKVVKGVSTDAALYSVTAVLGKADSRPSSNTLDFDV